LEVIPSWHLEPGYVRWLAERVTEAIGSLSPRARDPHVIFSAHSLPARISGGGDPYPEQLAATGEAVARSLGGIRWSVAWQSAGRTSEPWLGPDLLDVLEALAGDGVTGAVVCPCGFVADHLEVLYDVDIEAAARAEALGIELVRTRSPNDDPAFLDVLAQVVRNAFEERPAGR
jgi:ferrochelatase